LLRGRCASTPISVPGSRSRQRANSRSKAPIRKCPDPAGGIDEPRPLNAELGERRLERTVEDEGLHELRRLQQRIALAGRVGEVLVEASQEAGAQRHVGEIVRQQPALRVQAENVSRSSRAPSAIDPQSGLWRSSNSGATAS
jgi:hypothetical protein